MLQGTKTEFFSDVKLPIYAGMPLNNPKASPKLKKVGYEIFRHYYDNDQKDCQIGSERLKRVINK